MCESQENMEHNENPVLFYIPNKSAKKALRQKRKMRGVNKGHCKAVKFFELVFSERYSPRDTFYRRYRGIFTKTRSGKYFDKDYDWNNKKIALVNKYLWVTEARENRDMARIFVKKAKGLR